MMKRTICICLFCSICIACCNIFNNDNNSDDSGWEKASMPKQLLGSWEINGFFYMKISSSKITIDNREWNIDTIEKNSGEYRIVTKSSIQYRALYFKNITDTTAEKSVGYIAFTAYDAKTSWRDEWVLMTKEL